MDSLYFAWPYLVITVILLGATIYSLKHDERPILLKPHYHSKHGQTLKQRLMKGSGENDDLDS